MLRWVPLVSRATSAKAIGGAESDNLSFYSAASVPRDLKWVQCPKMQMCASCTESVKKKQTKNNFPILKVLQGGVLNGLHLITLEEVFTAAAAKKFQRGGRCRHYLTTEPTQTETKQSDVPSYNGTCSDSWHWCSLFRVSLSLQFFISYSAQTELLLLFNYEEWMNSIP